MAESQQVPQADTAVLEAIELPSFKHPMLQLIATTPGLPPTFQDVASALAEIFDTMRTKEARLRAAHEVDELVSHLNLGSAVHQTVLREIWQTLIDSIPSAALWEKCVLSELRDERIDFGTSLRAVLPDLPLAENTRLLANTTSRIMHPWIERMLSTPLQDFVLTVDDGKACIRMLRIYAMLEQTNDWMDEDGGGLTKRQLALLGLWKQIEQRMRELAAPQLHVGPRKKGARKMAEILGDPAIRTFSDEELFYPSYGSDARQTLLSFLLGRVEANRLPNARGALPDPAASGIGALQSGVDALPGAEFVDRHLVATKDYPPISGREDKDTLARFQVLRSPLPVARLPAAPALRAALTILHGEFPWASAAIDRIGGQLLARERCGSVELAWTPLLLVGQPGCGKSRLARRLAEVFTLPFLPMSLAGAHDTKLFLGTARSWNGAQPSPLLQFMLTHRCARGVVLLDEIEKTSQWDNGGGSLPGVLLNLLEPETAKRWYDGFLQVPCDLSKLLFVATANNLSGLSKPLLSRLEPILVPEPQRAHFAQVVQAVVRDIAADWGVPLEAIDTIDTTRIAAAARNVRQLRLMVLHELADIAATPRIIH